jgi:hypothetical protein
MDAWINWGVVAILLPGIDLAPCRMGAALIAVSTLIVGFICEAQ